MLFIVLQTKTRVIVLSTLQSLIFLKFICIETSVVFLTAMLTLVKAAASDVTALGVALY